MSTESFRQALERTLRFEGGFSDDPDDRGGKTKFGVTEGTWLRFNGGVPPYPVGDITMTDAEAVYYAHYWRKANLDRLEREDVSQLLLSDVFDACVHTGVHNGSKLLQQAYNFVRHDGAPLLKEDGVIGSKTAAAIQLFVVRKPEYLQSLLSAFCVERGIFIKTIIAKNPSQRKFIRGWMRRLM